MNLLPPASKRMRREFQQTGYAVIRGALPLNLTERWRQKAEQLKTNAFTIERSDGEFKLVYRVVTGEVIQSQWPELFAFYSDPSTLEARKNDDKEFTEIYNDLNGHYRQRLTALSDIDHSEGGAKFHKRLSQLSHELLRVERQTAVRLRNQGRINDEILREFERDLDLREAGYHAKGNT